MADIIAQDIETRRGMLAEQQRQARLRLKQAQADLDAIDGAIQETTYFEQLIVERDAAALVPIAGTAKQSTAAARKRPTRKSPTRRK